MDLIGSGCGGKSLRKRQENLRQYVEAPIREGVLESPWEKLIGGVVLGSEEFVERLPKGVRGDRREQAGMKVFQKPVKWDQIVRVVEQEKGEKWGDFHNRYGDWGRDVALYLGRPMGRMKLTELARVAGGIHCAVAGAAVSRVQKKLERGDLKVQMQRMKQSLSINEM